MEKRRGVHCTSVLKEITVKLAVQLQNQGGNFKMNNQKFKSNNGITLIALIITIIVLLILAVVAIGAVQNDGIINYAKNARDEYGKAQVTENTTLGGYLQEIEKNLPGNNGGGTSGGDVNSTPATTIAEAIEDAMLTKTVNSDVTDKYTNKITVPAGFKILVDETTGYTSEDIDVTKGIVITDGTNEFVWVPVGEKIYKSETEFETINLDRYTFASDGTPTPQGDAVISNYYKELSTSTYGNAKAKDLQGFINSANTKGGYYLARYEAGVANYDSSKTVTSNSNSETNWTGYVAEEGKKLEVVSKKDVQVWNYVTQNKASELSRNMYKEATTYTSDLVNSYAWDTAIVFIQTFSTEADASNYFNLNKSTSFADTGVNADKYCNIYDMSGNAREWSTETYSDAVYPCVRRGGYYSALNVNANNYTSSRGYHSSNGAYSSNAFRPLLYVAL